jgi:hypothetical protein
MKQVFNFIDNCFSHHKAESGTDSTTAGRDPDTILWDRSLSDLNRPSFYSHEKMLMPDKKTKNNYGLIIESRAIIPQLYTLVEGVLHEFKTVYTHNSDFLKKYDNCKWVPANGTWVGSKLHLCEMQVYKKSKLCSMVSSKKTMCEGHINRLSYFNRLQVYKFIDFFGANTGYIPHTELIYKTLKDYMFSIAMENFVDDLYVTEKILNCFATGTIPIYYGARNIDKLFNPQGILIFNNFEELDTIVNSITPELYLSRIDAIYENFEKVKNYKCVEDFITSNYEIK